MTCKDLFNNGAIIFHHLYHRGQTEISKFLDKNRLDEIIKNAQLFDILNNDIDVIKYVEKINQNDLFDSIVYLIALDLKSNDNSILINYTKSKRDFGCSLSDNKDVMIFPTYSSVDHYYKGYECFQSLFHYLIFIDVSIFHNASFSIHNYYIDDIFSTNRINVAYIPYPIKDSVLQRNKNDLYVEEKISIDDSDKLFLKRVNNLLKGLNENIPTIVFSPEMVGSNNVDLEIKKIARANKKIAAFIAPTYHKSLNGIFYNCGTIFINEDNETVKDMNKKYHPCQKEKMVQGDLITINLIHIKGFGKIISVICRDFLTELYKEIIKLITAEVVIVQCYTGHLREFKSVAHQICEINNCVIIGNACSAFSSNESNQNIIVCASRTKFRENNNVMIQTSKKVVCNECVAGCDKNDNCNVLVELSINQDESNDYHPINYISAEIGEVLLDE